MDEVQIDKKQRGRARLFTDYVRVPEFFNNGSWHIKTHEARSQKQEARILRLSLLTCVFCIPALLICAFLFPFQ